MKASSYTIGRINSKMQIDSDWHKPAWEKIKSLAILNDNGWKSNYSPSTEVKLAYDDATLYMIFRVKDQFVRCVTREFNGPVWQDSCVEFFFSPNPGEPNNYFNLEINCGGTMLMAYRRFSDGNRMILEIPDLQKIEIAHSMPEIIEKEINTPVTWTVEYKMPLDILEKYIKISKPENGAVWKANFYKCAEKNSYPHWLSWNKIDFHEPNFHLPQYFGELQFK